MIWFAIYILGCVISLALFTGLMLYAIIEEMEKAVFERYKIDSEKMFGLIIIITLMSWAGVILFIRTGTK